VCWAFAAIAGIEANIIRTDDSLTPDNPLAPNLSELHMAYSTSSSNSNTHGFNRLPNGGGNRSIASAYLMRGVMQGTVPQTALPYAPFVNSDIPVTYNLQTLRDMTKNYTVQNILFLSGNDKINTTAFRTLIKEYIVSNGSVSASMFWEGGDPVGGQSPGSTPAYNAATKAYFYNGTATVNHAITLIGWDDNFDRNNFNASRRPANNGAWLVQNSWGDSWGEKGNFWISYDDTRAPLSAWVIDGVKAFDTGRKVYEYDFHGYEAGQHYNLSTIFGANIFSGAKGEFLEEVIYFIPEANTCVSIYIVPTYTDISSLNINSIPPANKAMTDNTHKYPGWYTFRLPNKNLITGDQFAVILEYSLENGASYVPLSRMNTQGVSFMAPFGTTQWNATNRNVIIKAVTAPFTLTEAQVVEEDKKWLTWDIIKGVNDLNDNVRANLTLPANGHYGSTITWASNNTAVVSKSGVVTRPVGDTDVAVTLTAAITKGLVTPDNTPLTFALTVKAAKSDADSVTADKEWLTWDLIKNSNTAQNNVITNLSLPVSGRDGSLITWTSSNAAVISNSGVVTRPVSDVNVTLTAAITKGLVTPDNTPLTFALTVKAANIISGGELPPANAVIVPANGNPSAFINLTAETITLPEGFSVAAFSLDGGTKWRRGGLPNAARFPRLLNRGMTLHLTNSWEQKDKKPGDGAQIITFPEIGARPRRNAERLAPLYGDVNWVLAKRGDTSEVFTGYEYAPSSNGKTPNEGIWYQMPQGGIPIASSGRATFLVRAAPNSTTAASVPWRVRPAVFGKAPSYKIRQVKDGDDRVAAVAFRKGDQYAVGDRAFGDVLTDKQTIHVSVLREQGEVLRVRRGSTGRRPPSAIQSLTLP
jgi:C1A family cysteine protease